VTAMKTLQHLPGVEGLVQIVVCEVRVHNSAESPFSCNIVTAALTKT
jgi:hypothetical protein